MCVFLYPRFLRPTECESRTKQDTEHASRQAQAPSNAAASHTAAGDDDIGPRKARRNVGGNDTGSAREGGGREKPLLRHHTAHEVGQGDEVDAQRPLYQSGRRVPMEPSPAPAGVQR